jgi:membrane protease YdiL (CAAX protease family)
VNKKEIAIISILTLVITFMDISGIPAVLLFDFTIADVDSFIIPLMINFIYVGIVAFLILRFLCPSWEMGLSTKGLLNGLKKYSLAGIMAGLLSCIAFWIGLRPFDYEPTVWKILFEGILYYVGVGIIEELYVRGLFLNVVEKLAYKSKNKTSIAILISSIVFGLGHIPGMIGMSKLVVIFKVISTIGMGIYFGTIYKKTENLWISIIMHIFIDICALPYCFTTFSGYKTVSLVCLVLIYTLLGIYSLVLMKDKEKKESA